MGVDDICFCASAILTLQVQGRGVCQFISPLWHPFGSHKMLKNPNIHTAESSWKLNACLRCPAYFHNFNNFTIKIIFSQILTL